MSKFIYKGTLNEKYIAGTILSDNIEANKVSVNTLDSTREDINILKNVDIDGDLSVSGTVNADFDSSTIKTNTITSDNNSINISKSINTNGISNTGTITSTSDISTTNLKLDNANKKLKFKSGSTWKNYTCDGQGTLIGKNGTGTNGEIFNNYSSNVASGNYSHAEGSATTASGISSHSGGSYTIASQENETVLGTYNIDETGRTTNKLFVIGNGDSNNRNDAFYVKSNGESFINGQLLIQNEFDNEEPNKSVFKIDNNDDNIIDNILNIKQNKDVVFNGSDVSGFANLTVNNKITTQNLKVSNDAFTNNLYVSGTDTNDAKVKFTGSSETLDIKTSSGNGTFNYNGKIIGPSYETNNYIVSKNGNDGIRLNGTSKAIQTTTDGSTWNNISFGQGSEIGKLGTGTSAEIFNDYSNNTSSANYSHAEGNNTKATGAYSHSEGHGTTASGTSSHAEGENSQSIGAYSHAEGRASKSPGNYSHSECWESISFGENSHGEGYKTRAFGINSHSEGKETVAGGYNKAASSSTASDFSGGNHAHAEGWSTIAYGQASHAEGRNTMTCRRTGDSTNGYSYSGGNYAHAEGYSTIASGECSHAGGNSTIASQSYETVIGKFNVDDTGSTTNKLFVVGNGTAANSRSDAFIVYNNGNATLNGDLFLNSNVIKIGKGNCQFLTYAKQNYNDNDTITRSIDNEDYNYVITGNIINISAKLRPNYKFISAYRSRNNLSSDFVNEFIFNINLSTIKAYLDDVYGASSSTFGFVGGNCVFDINNIGNFYYKFYTSPSASLTAQYSTGLVFYIVGLEGSGKYNGDYGESEYYISHFDGLTNYNTFNAQLLYIKIS